MKLKSMNAPRVETAKRALRENYEINLTLEKMTRKECQKMLTQVKQLIAESRAKPMSASINNKKYMKLVFLEQALGDHMLALDKNIPKIIVENKTVDRSEVYLAAEELANSLQAMVEEVGDMLNKELPALVKSIETKIGIKESGVFNTSASETINALLPNIKQALDSMNAAIDVLTGDESAAAASGETGQEMPAQGMPEQGAEQPAAPAPAEAPGEVASPEEVGAGRALR